MNKKTKELKLGDVYVHPKNMSKKIQLSKLGDVRVIPLFIN
jgi:hypothetical protein